MQLQRSRICTYHQIIMYVVLRFGISLYFIWYSFLGFCGQISHLRTLFVVQKTAVRIISHASYNSHTSTLFCLSWNIKNWGYLQLFLGRYMFSQINGPLPERLNREISCYLRNIHEYNTRSTASLHKFHRWKSLVKNTFIHRGDWLSKLIQLCQLNRRRF